MVETFYKFTKTRSRIRIKMMRLRNTCYGTISKILNYTAQWESQRKN
jgi:hypothetical protein